MRALQLLLSGTAWASLAVTAPVPLLWSPWHDLKHYLGSLSSASAGLDIKPCYGRTPNDFDLPMVVSELSPLGAAECIYSSSSVLSVWRFALLFLSWRERFLNPFAFPRQALRHKFISAWGSSVLSLSSPHEAG